MFQFLTSTLTKRVLSFAATTAATYLVFETGTNLVGEHNAWENTDRINTERVKRPNLFLRLGDIFVTSVKNIAVTIPELGRLLGMPIAYLRSKALIRKSSKVDNAARAEQDPVRKADLLTEAEEIHLKLVKVTAFITNGRSRYRTRAERRYDGQVNKLAFPQTDGAMRFEHVTNSSWVNFSQLTKSGDKIADQWIHGDAPLANNILYGLLNGATQDLDTWLLQLKPLTRSQLNAFRLGVQLRITHEINLGNIAFSEKEVNPDQKQSTARKKTA